VFEMQIVNIENVVLFYLMTFSLFWEIRHKISLCGQLGYTIFFKNIAGGLAFNIARRLR
jgi:hypothetical protein